MADRSWAVIGFVGLSLVVTGCGPDSYSGGRDAGSSSAGGGSPSPGNGGEGGAYDAAGSGVKHAGDADAATPLHCDRTSAPRVFYLSTDDSSSMASAAHVRELLRLGRAPAPAQVRTHEFLNYYRVRYELKPADEPLGLFPQAELAKESPGFRFVLGVQARSFSTPLSLTFVVDTSSSMSGDSMARAIVAMKAAASQLTAGDRVSIVTWDVGGGIRLDGHEIQSEADTALLAAIDGLEADGGADLQGALDRGYALAAKHYRDGATNRVVLISDGGASTASIDRKIIAENAADAQAKGIYLVGVGTGPAIGYNDALMDYVTDAGRGSYVYLDSPEEAQAMFEERLHEVLVVAARDVRLELKLPPFLRIEQFYGEEFSEDPTEIEPQHLAAGDAMVFDHAISSCEQLDPAMTDPIEAKITWTDPQTGKPREAVRSLALGELIAAGGPQLEKVKAITTYAEALKTLDQRRLHAADEAVRNALSQMPEDADLAEIADLITQHPGF